MSSHAYDNQDKAAVYRVISERRDVRHFNSEPVAEETLKRILIAGHAAPSVGLMQPWRFIRITDEQKRSNLKAIVESERIKTAEALGERQDEFMKLKVEGMSECAELIVVAMPDGREAHVFGRRTLPEMDLASTACAIQNMWLAARAEGIGMGWVSLFCPEQLRAELEMPKDSLPIAILCIGHVDQFYEKPMLVLEKWAEEKPLSEMLFENQWES